ncbi:MAG: Dabb family protein [Spirochaetales bacterium]
MLFHLVAFRFKPENKHSVGEAVARLRAMAPLIGEVLDLKVGSDVVHSGRSYDLGLVVTLKDEAALAVYNEHPAHLPVKAFLAPLYEQAVAVDFISE